MNGTPAYEVVIERLQYLADTMLYGYLVMLAIVAVLVVMTVWSNHRSKEEER